MKILLYLAAFLAGIAPALAAPACGKDRIGVADSAGTSIRLESGLFYQVYPGEDANVKFWEPLDHVIVCPAGGPAVKITDLDRKGETIQALREF